MKQFIFFLLDTPTGKAYYYDNSGILKIQIVTAGATDVSLKNAPGNWLDTELSFARNTVYHALNRAYSTPLDMVRDELKMIKQLFLLGTGTEVPLSLAVFKYNSQPVADDPQYKLYFKANLDLPKISEQVLETLTVNLMEGGVTQLLKSYEGTSLQIPCDGSIVENQKINMDGQLVADVLYYNITPLNDIYETDYNSSLSSTLPCYFVNNESDNYGISHNDPGIQALPSGEFDNTIIPATALSSYNYLFFSQNAIDVNLKGNLIVRFNKVGLVFQMFVATSGGQYYALSSKLFGYNNKETIVNFNTTVSLQANEKLFIFFQINYIPYGGETGHNVMDFLSGAFSLSFESKPEDSRVWAITALDLFKLIVKQICLLASTTNQMFNYDAVSNLLAANQNLFYTSGDALRASNDSSYQRFFSISQTNQILQTSFGPTIKINLKDFFTDMEVILFAALGPGHNGIAETLFIEALTSVYDSSIVSMSLGEVASLKWSYAADLGFSDLNIGYASQSYDQKAGKYEYNTTLQMKAPIKSFSKKLEKIAKARTDSYGIERIRSNVGAPTSTTKNSGDSDSFIINVDPSKFIYDYFRAYFSSLITDPDSANNTNLLLQQNVRAQQMNMPYTDGEYFQSNTDQAIIVFSDPAYAATEASNFSLNATINSINKPTLAPVDSITIRLWRNGVALYSNTFPVTGINTSVIINYSFSQPFAYEDCIYATVETTATCEANINTASLTIGSYTSASAANIPVDGGVAQKLLSWNTIIPTSKPFTVGTSVVQYGFQYFVFNSIVPNTNFSLQYAVQGYIWNQIADVVFKVYINGVQQSETIIINGSVARIPFPLFPVNGLVASTPITRNYTLGDIIFFTVSPLGNILNVELTGMNASFTSNYIKAYSLKRVQYDYLQGIPNLAKDASGKIRTDIAGAPYNIEDLTPKTLYRKWRNYWMSTFMTKVTGQMTVQSLSKNEYLQRAYNGVTIIENADEDIMGFTRMFYPIEIEAKVNVPIGFAEAANKAVNQHIHLRFMGVDIYMFPDTLNQKPSLNESQTWKGLLSPKTDINAFANISNFKLPDMAPNSISYAFASSIQHIPYAQTIPDKYHTLSRNQFLFKDQLETWLNKDDYGQPVQIGDPLTLQYISRDLTAITYTVFNYEDNSIYLGPTSLDNPASPAIPNSYYLWQKFVDTSGWNRGIYYLVIKSSSTNLLRTEPLFVLTPDECEGTVLIEFTSSFNTQGMIFDTGFIGAMRFRGGFNNLFKQKYLGKFYVDQPQDITVLNAIPYETTSLFTVDVPDYVPKKILRQLLMDGTTLDGEGFTLNEGAEFEAVVTKGAPKKIQKIDIRPSRNNDYISVTSAGTDESSMIVSVNPQSFGPNITNSSGTTETDLIEITVG